MSSEIGEPLLSFVWCKKADTFISRSPSSTVKSSLVAVSSVTTLLNSGVVVQTSWLVLPVRPAVYLNNPLVYVSSANPSVASTASHPLLIVKYTLSEKLLST